jgi:hypothetical protein
MAISRMGRYQISRAPTGDVKFVLTLISSFTNVYTAMQRKDKFNLAIQFRFLKNDRDDIMTSWKVVHSNLPLKDVLQNSDLIRIGKTVTTTPALRITLSL